MFVPLTVAILHANCNLHYIWAEEWSFTDISGLVRFDCYATLQDAFLFNPLSFDVVCISFDKYQFMFHSGM